MSVVFFVSGFLTMMAGKKDTIRPFMIQHLQELMEDMELYGWKHIPAFHAV